MRILLSGRSIPSPLVLVGQTNLGSSAACAAFLPKTASDPNCLAEITKHSILLTDVEILGEISDGTLGNHANGSV